MVEGDLHFDCLIIGAGICGIDAAYHVQKYSPWANYAVLERSSNIGGTWDQIKYPGRPLNPTLSPSQSLPLILVMKCGVGLRP